MFSPLVSLINDIALGPQHRKVKQYFGQATRNSVPGDLEKVLLPQLKSFKERDLVQATFDKYCIEDPSSHQEYWTIESFRNHVRGTHSASAVSDAAIALLWKSFHFYAYHPFPPDLDQHARVDLDAFRRATLLTVFQCDSLLGTRELDWYWRQDAAFFRRASFARLFRSIAVPDHVSLEQPQSDMTSSLSDAIDVLVMIAPQFIHAGPSELQLESVAWKLFAEGLPVARRQIVRREDLSALINLLLGLELQEGRGDICYRLGDAVQGTSEEEDSTKAFVDALAGEDNGQAIAFQQLFGAIELMPDLLSRFLQLWAVLFYSSGGTIMTKPRIADMN
ncbi:hypothetical protein F5B18DRAFT_640510 [Nemania serpens]|nr:hypothetical protein F5B18DRAFT_640510 [Nemania serpens]